MLQVIIHNVSISLRAAYDNYVVKRNSSLTGSGDDGGGGGG